jgi:hypothetical protein
MDAILRTKFGRFCTGRQGGGAQLLRHTGKSVTQENLMKYAGCEDGARWIDERSTPPGIQYSIAQANNDDAPAGTAVRRGRICR